MNAQKQHGFNALIIVLLIALVGVIGFVGWRMYDSSQQANNQQNAQNGNGQTQEPTTDPNEGYVVIKEWGVRFKPVEGLSGVEYFKPKGLDENTYSITTKELGAVEPECGKNSQSYALGLLTRAEEVEPENGGVIATIGKYSYQYRVSSANCVADTTNAQMKSQTLQRIIKSIETLEVAK
jgi:hypothetical protein